MNNDRKDTMKEEESFKIIDKRHSQSEGEKEEETKKDTASFVMKDGPSEDTKEESSNNAIYKLDISTLFLSIGSGIFIHLGVAPDPATGKKVKNLLLAQQNIELLSLLQEKTKGNLTTEEEKLLTNLLTDVRLKYVEEKGK